MDVKEQEQIAEAVKKALDMELQQRGFLTSSQVEGVVDRAVKRTLTTLGFPADVTEVQQDIAYLRRLRRGSEKTGFMVKWLAMSTFMTTGIVLFWDGIKALAIQAMQAIMNGQH